MSALRCKVAAALAGEKPQGDAANLLRGASLAETASAFPGRARGAGTGHSE